MMLHRLQELYLNLSNLIWPPPRPISTCQRSYATQEQREKFDEERLSGKQGQSGTGKETTMVAFYTKLKEASNEIKRVVSS